jgi:uncharacterized protein with HEPN domain
VKDPRVYLAHILECIERIESYAGKGKDAFLAESMIQDAVIRNFEVIGEAAKRIPDAYRQANPSIPWRNLAAFRDVLIHQYEGVNPARVLAHCGSRLAAIEGRHSCPSASARPIGARSLW